MAESNSVDDVFIAMMGLTGSGKSTFISKCCDGLVDIIGHSLWSRNRSK
jgi:ABC-type proline/glycine betaine transport system ATPase subunit